MKISDYGYREKTIKIRNMSIAELKVAIFQLAAEKNYHFVKVKLVDITSGDVDVFETPKDFVLAKMNDGYEISLIRIREVDIYNTETSASEKTLVVLIEDMED